VTGAAQRGGGRGHKRFNGQKEQKRAVFPDLIEIGVAGEERGGKKVK